MGLESLHYTQITGLGTLATQSGTFSGTHSGTSSGTNTGDQDLSTYLTISSAASTYQPVDSDLTTIAGLTATTDSFMQAKGSAWAARTISQVKTDLGLTGTNSGDQSTIVGITGTKAQFNTAVTDGDIVYLDSTDTITGVKTMSGLNSILHSSSGVTIRNPADTFSYTITAGAILANRTLTLPLTAGTIALTSDITGTNSGTNTGDQTITLTGDVTGSGTGSFVTTIAAGAVDIAMLSATGSASSSTFLRGDNTWATPAGSGDVSKVGTPVNNQIGIWTGDGTLEGDAALTYDSATDVLTSVNFAGNLTGNASTVTTNANLTGHVTSTGNAAVLGSFSSSNLSTALSDKTGTGVSVFATSPTLVTPVLGVAAATTINKVTLTAPATGSTLTIADGQTLTVNGSATITNGTHSGTNTGDQTSVTGNAGTVTVADAAGDTSTWVMLATSQTGSLAPATDAGLTYNATTDALTATTFVGALTGTASGNLVSGGALGTPSSGTLTNCTFPTLNQNTSGSAASLTNTRTIGGSNFNGTANVTSFPVPGAIGGTTPAAGTFTTLLAGSTTSLLLGTAGSAVGNIGFRNATSGTITLAPVAGALGTVTLTLPAITDTIVTLTANQTLTTKTLTSPTLTTPVLGTPSSGTLTSCTGLPISTGVSGLGTGIATFLATPSSANLITAITDETGSGSLVFSATPTFSGTVTMTGGLVVTGTVRIASETNYTPAGTTQAISFVDGNHQTLTLTSSSGNVTVTITVPGSTSAGTLIVKQHASSSRDITWAVSAGTIKWMGTEPTWNTDATSSVRIVSWRYDGSVMYLAATDVGT